MANAWEFDELLDTPKSFEAFIIYRDLGPRRSLDQVDAIVRGETQPSCKRVTGRVNKWSASGNWPDRAAKFDAENDRLRITKMRENNQSQHDQKIEQMRQVLENTGFLCLNAAYLSAQIIAGAIEQIHSECQIEVNGKIKYQPTAKQLNTLATIARIRTADAGAIVAAITIADEALGIKALQRQLNPDT